jgi:hypothetical protein
LRLWTHKDCSTSTARCTVIQKFSTSDFQVTQTVDSASIFGTIVPESRRLKLYQGSRFSSDSASVVIAVDIVFKYRSERFKATVRLYRNGSFSGSLEHHSFECQLGISLHLKEGVGAVDNALILRSAQETGTDQI